MPHQHKLLVIGKVAVVVINVEVLVKPADTVQPVEDGDSHVVAALVAKLNDAVVVLKLSQLVVSDADFRV